ncbi:LysR family transcriptional regulator [Bordetella genomosp. 10]|uniref:LysR family transcriptional regulator n=1 Tax=Bordetella genomosp. 10 TaxID=1416804 RepID=A0A261SIV7_9BORD|nr:LysR family transcriptional regulator [Bordetella genomosp. 10]OZI36971.1 LysR family transcriptional regulator [Bordetella genomosp. 10]
MSNHVSLRHLRCFVAVARSGSFTAAAARLYMTQSSLTHVIQQFEEAVGVKLFDRSTRRVSMTEEAERYLAEAEQMVKRFDASIADLKAFASVQRGHLHIAAAASMIDYYLYKVIELFREQFPQITVSIRDAGAQQVEQLVAEGAIDFAVASRHRGLEDLLYTPLLADRYGVLVAAGDPLARSSAPLAWSELGPERYIGFSADTGIDSFLRKHARGFRQREGHRNEASSTTSLFSLLKSAGNYSVVPALTVQHGYAHKLHFRPLKSPQLMREICLISRRLRSLSPGAEAFLALLRQVLRDTPVPPHTRIAAAAPSGKVNPS